MRKIIIMFSMLLFGSVASAEELAVTKELPAALKALNIKPHQIMTKSEAHKVRGSGWAEYAACYQVCLGSSLRLTPDQCHQHCLPMLSLKLGPLAVEAAKGVATGAANLAKGMPTFIVVPMRTDQIPGYQMRTIQN
tara:strand:- start:161 stop:568 length:408 start_codon:yes stop_codon:yes gene_type:complete